MSALRGLDCPLVRHRAVAITAAVLRHSTCKIACLHTRLFLTGLEMTWLADYFLNPSQGLHHAISASEEVRSACQWWGFGGVTGSTSKIIRRRLSIQQLSHSYTASGPSIKLNSTILTNNRPVTYFAGLFEHSEPRLWSSSFLLHLRLQMVKQHRIHENRDINWIRK